MELEYLANICVIDNLIGRAHSERGLQTVHTNLCIYKYKKMHSVQVWAESMISCTPDKHSTTELHSRQRMLLNKSSIIGKKKLENLLAFPWSS